MTSQTKYNCRTYLLLQHVTSGDPPYRDLIATPRIIISVVIPAACDTYSGISYATKILSSIGIPKVALQAVHCSNILYASPDSRFTTVKSTESHQSKADCTFCFVLNFRSQLRALTRNIYLRLASQILLSLASRAEDLIVEHHCQSGIRRRNGRVR